MCFVKERKSESARNALILLMQQHPVDGSDDHIQLGIQLVWCGQEYSFGRVDRQEIDADQPLQSVPDDGHRLDQAMVFPPVVVLSDYEVGASDRRRSLAQFRCIRC